MNKNYRPLIFGILLILFVGAFAGGSHVVSASDSSTTVNKPVFIWMFGYTGNSFFPQSQLKVDPSQAISAAQQMSNSVGKSNLRIVGALGL